jgi:hypothetical protein
MSITSQRYSSQKINMLAAGLDHLLYIVEGRVEGLGEGKARAGGGQRRG